MTDSRTDKLKRALCVLGAFPQESSPSPLKIGNRVARRQRLRCASSCTRGDGCGQGEQGDVPLGEWGSREQAEWNQRVSGIDMYMESYGEHDGPDSDPLAERAI